MSADAVDPAGPPPMTTTSGVRSLMVETRMDSHGHGRHDITKSRTPRGITLLVFRVSCFRGLRFVLCIPNAAVLRHEEIRQERVDPEQPLARQADHVRRRLGDVAARMTRLQ